MRRYRKSLLIWGMISLTFLAISPSLIFSQGINEDTRVLSSGTWVELENPEQGNDFCGIRDGGTVTPVDVFEGSILLLLYEHNRPQEGTDCPPGALFLIPLEEYLGITK